ncbi:hypothetical protein niasHT_017901 [Heterodera trifolii]|uniref:Uncharacterized protein n=1 Tax=Heterodera trifolii TaxID=157864 RepID=A0ABD2I0T8_9BILA
MLFFLFASLILPILCSAAALPPNYLPPSNSSDALCIVYFDYRNPAMPRLTVMPQEMAFNYTQWKDCARKCSDFVAAGHEKRQWNHTCHPGKEFDCKITFNWGQLSAAGECPSLYNQLDHQQQQDKHSGSSSSGTKQIEKANSDVHVSGMCLLFADNRTTLGFKIVEMKPPEWKLPQFGTCAQKCVKFGPNHDSWKITCNLPSGDQCQIRRDGPTFGMHGFCPVMRANGTYYFAQLFTDLMAERRTSTSAAANFAFSVYMIFWSMALFFGTIFGGGQWHFGIAYAPIK